MKVKNDFILQSDKYSIDEVLDKQLIGDGGTKITNMFSAFSLLQMW
jgi:hypothetical protein